MVEKKKDDNVIISSKQPIEKYIFISLLSIEKYNEVCLSACGHNIMKLERVARLLCNAGLKEVSRKSNLMYSNKIQQLEVRLIKESKP